MVFSIRDLSYVDPTGVARLQQIDFAVHAGEIVGIAGVEGNGQFELVNTIIGLLEPKTGSIRVQNNELTTAIDSGATRSCFVRSPRSAPHG